MELEWITQQVFVGDALVPFLRSLLMLIDRRELGAEKCVIEVSEKCAFGVYGCLFADSGSNSESDPDSVRSSLANLYVSMIDATKQPESLRLDCNIKGAWNLKICIKTIFNIPRSSSHVFTTLLALHCCFSVPS
jgi:hypothetical protein